MVSVGHLKSRAIKIPSPLHASFFLSYVCHPCTLRFPLLPEETLFLTCTVKPQHHHHHLPSISSLPGSHHHRHCQAENQASYSPLLSLFQLTSSPIITPSFPQLQIGANQPFPVTVSVLYLHHPITLIFGFAETTTSPSLCCFGLAQHHHQPCRASSFRVYLLLLLGPKDRRPLLVAWC